MGPHHALKGLPPGRVPGGLAAIADHGGEARTGERRLAQQELRDAFDHHAPLPVEAVLTEGAIDRAARVDLDVRGGEPARRWVMFDNMAGRPSRG